ncbi:MAG: hypothetical protein AAGH71_07630 [Planctomycetota bacterium]
MSERKLYVGYLPLLGRHRGIARAAGFFGLIAAAAIGYGVAASMNQPGQAVWDTASIAEFRGVLRSEPVVFLETDAGPVLLVEQGKFGARTSAGDMAGQRVIARGARLERGSIRMLELLPGDAAIEPTSEALTDRARAPAPADSLRLTGEILDSKCYLGAMKPGEGRAHKACATLCIRGGIPAIFVGSTSEGVTRWGVLPGAGAGGVLTDPWMALIGQRITIDARLTTVDSLPVLTEASIVGDPQG